MEYTKELHNWCYKIFQNVTNDEHRDMFMTLLDELERLQSLTQWVPVTERLPDVFQSVLVLLPGNIQSIGRLVDSQNTKLWETVRSRDSLEAGITHWMPLPEGVK